jgi:hypothetical protein
MCDPRVISAGLAAALLAAGRPGVAQTTAALRAQLERLRQEHATAITAASRVDSVRAVGIRVDTIRAGALTVLAAWPAGASVRSATAQAWRLLHPRFGDGAGVLAGIEFVVQPALGPDILPLARGTRVRPLLIPREATGRSSPAATAFEIDVDTATLARWIAARAAAEVAAHQDTAFRNWLRGNVNAESDDTRGLEAAYVEMVTVPWTTVKRCYLGDLDGCRHAIGLVPERDPLDQWYDAEDRRRLVATGAADGYRRTRPVERSACVDGRNIDACTALLRRLPSLSIEPPFPSGQRALVELALDRGGLGAYSRLMASPDRPLADRLAAAAGLPEDSLLAAWRARVIVSRPRAVTLTPRGAWAAFVWILVLGALALQSTRWR